MRIRWRPIRRFGIREPREISRNGMVHRSTARYSARKDCATLCARASRTSWSPLKINDLSRECVISLLQQSEAESYRGRQTNKRSLFIETVVYWSKEIFCTYSVRLSFKAPWKFYSCILRVRLASELDRDGNRGNRSRMATGRVFRKHPCENIPNAIVKKLIIYLKNWRARTGERGWRANRTSNSIFTLVYILSHLTDRRNRYRFINICNLFFFPFCFVPFFFNIV